jgi:fused signal recognition particle receptor
MFDFLKKKITNFTEKLKEALQTTKEETTQQQTQQKEQTKTTEQIQKTPKEIQTNTTKEETTQQQTQQKEQTKTTEQIQKTPKEIQTNTTKEETTQQQTQQKQSEKEETPQPMEKTQPINNQKLKEKKTFTEIIKGIFTQKQPPEKKTTQISEDKRELKAETGVLQKVTGIVTGKIKINEKDTQNFFDELELSLLESDVEQETASAIVKQLKNQLIGKEISAKEDLTNYLNNEIKKALAKVMETEKINLAQIEKKPLKILFLGPNGAGKTTTIAKIANYFLKINKSVIMAAGDTFRAASIEQLETHANKLGVKIVKQNYGSDPAAVAFDAVKAAEAKNIDIVLIDTAGRQETNKNLVEELKKIDRVIKPDIKLYVGEAYTGQALLQQASEFNKAIGIDGFILTKIDADAKGGTAISLLYTLKKPIVFIGTGQNYDDLIEFKPEFIIDRII